MRRLIKSNAFCLLVVLVVGLFAFSFLAPGSAIAKTDYTNGSGMAEGDPGDGLGYAAGGGGLLDDGSNKASNPDLIKFSKYTIEILVPGYLTNSGLKIIIDFERLNVNQNKRNTGGH